jgi:hypothetical protein
MRIANVTHAVGTSPLCLRFSNTCTRQPVLSVSADKTVQPIVLVDFIQIRPAAV